MLSSRSDRYSLYLYCNAPCLIAPPLLSPGLIRHFQPEMEDRINNSATYNPDQYFQKAWSGAPLTDQQKKWVADVKKAQLK